mgnify:CR=1 FL=1
MNVVPPLIVSAMDTVSLALMAGGLIVSTSYIGYLFMDEILSLI